MFEIEDLTKLAAAAEELAKLKLAEKRHYVEESQLLRMMARMTENDYLYEWAYDYEREVELTEDEMRALEWEEEDIQETLEDRRRYHQEITEDRVIL